MSSKRSRYDKLKAHGDELADSLPREERFGTCDAEEDAENKMTGR